MNTLSLRQAGLLCSIAILSSKFLVLPSLLYEESFSASIFSVVLILLLEFFLLFFMINLKKQNKLLSFEQVFNKRLGKIVGKIIIFLLFAFFLFKFFYLLEENFSFLKQTLYTEATTLVYLICVLPVVNAMVYKGLKSFGRTTEIFYFVIIACLVFSTFSWFFNFQEFNFTVVLSKGIEGLVNAFFKYTFWFADIVFFMIILDKVKFNQKEIKNFYFYVIFSFVLVAIFMFAYFVAYQTTSFIKNNAIYDISQFSNYFGTIGKFGIISITGIAIMLFFELAIYLFCANECLKKLFPFGHKAQPLILINLIVLIACFFVFLDSNLMLIFFSENISYFSVFIAYVIFPLYLIFLSTLKKRRHK